MTPNNTLQRTRRKRRPLNAHVRSPMYRIAFAIVLFWLPLASTQALACTCSRGTASFSELASKSEVVVHVRVEAHEDLRPGPAKRYLSMVVSVVSVLIGDEPSKSIKIWGDPGDLCRPYVADFAVGTEWLMIPHHLLRSAHDPGPEPRFSEYAISACGVYYLQVLGDKVFGPVDGGREDLYVPVSDVVSELASDPRLRQDAKMRYGPPRR